MSARDSGFARALRSRVQGAVKEAEPLGRYSTYRIGGPATVLMATSPADVALALEACGEAGVPWFVLGLGSNILLPDEGLDALVIRIGKGMDRIQNDGPRWKIGAGLPAPLAARRTAEAGWAGLHVMVGVPGSVGGGVYMNAGCHGAEWRDVVESVTIARAEGDLAVLSREEIPFSYRRSGLEHCVVLETEVLLRPESSERLTEEVNHLFRWRQEGTPFTQPCCGSTFKNPEAGPPGANGKLMTAGQLIEAAGLKGHTIGGVQVSPKHANYFVNLGSGTAADVRVLINHARERIRDQFGVELETEVKLVDEDGQYLPAIES
ncbi:MAG: UDP-N-acetylmuramate dehydrogenase [Gemmatimonadota bacterium]